MSVGKIGSFGFAKGWLCVSGKTKCANVGGKNYFKCALAKFLKPFVSD
jgi:hypothetical protein